MSISIDGKIAEVEILLRKHRDLWNDMRLFLVTHHSWLRVYDGNFEKHEELIEYVIIRGLEARRGEILNIFSKIEFLVNQLIQAHLLGLFSSKARLLDDTLEYVDLFSRWRLLQEWKILDKKEDKDEEVIGIFMHLKEVRNGLAHRWREAEVNYKGQTLTQNLQQFREDLEKVWKVLIQKYMEEQDKKIDELIDTLKSEG